ncbi:hypothetical protein OBV_38040 [Oscillibacter valericigenes Sjm18-20]|nr:hypothetical protein OBV_38040 [Oscillibacter valericigenes Sjm18-20]
MRPLLYAFAHCPNIGRHPSPPTGKDSCWAEPLLGQTNQAASTASHRTAVL